MKFSYLRQLDGVRAICILLTLCVHVKSPGRPELINGSVGVDVFFALSGYLITTLLVKDVLTTGRIAYREFYVRRLFRIVPVYFFAILCYLPSTLMAYRVHHDGAGVRHYVHALPWLLTFNREFRDADAGALLGHAWTLGIEWKFYMLWPLILGFVLGKKGRVKLLLPLAVGIFAATLLWGSDKIFRGYTGLMAGAAAAMAVEYVGGRWRSRVEAVSEYWWLGLVGLCYLVVLSRPSQYWNVLISMSSALLIASLVHRSGSVLIRGLSAAPLADVGLLTYSIYMFHRLAGHAVDEVFQKMHVETFWGELLATYAVSIVMCWLIYRGVEKPMIGLGRRFVGRRRERGEQRRAGEGRSGVSRVAPGLTGLPVLSGTTLGSGNPGRS